ncbi:hemerythrin domain-containing protein [Rhodoferax bucti]|uniref:hemerythrin domain-containing protein n=1 Tax=Rhodoferax bucti TaxID=2576305 RepID=UPI0011090321|nr:hemerythrin domain-containing protein [Rhodoferax bucti]
MTRTTEQPTYDALDACHRQIQEHVFVLKAMVERLAAQGVDDVVRAQAAAIEAFFSSTSREHHAEEEAKVFPALLHSGDAALVAAVRSLQQDHGWIEENWIELAPRLRAIATGQGWIDEAELLSYVDVFTALMEDHIALEETLIYPESKARWAQAVAARRQRLGAPQAA